MFFFTVKMLIITWRMSDYTLHKCSIWREYRMLDCEFCDATQCALQDDRLAKTFARILDTRSMNLNRAQPLRQLAIL